MADRDESENQNRIFTLSEANRLLPQLRDYLTAIKQGKAILIRTKDEIKKASANAEAAGGSPLGALYITALQQIGESLHAVQEMGVLVKDIDLGLCDFPYLLDGRIVYLCWKLGESEIRWWHEVTRGYKDRHPLETFGS
ncbi:MAG TPA: DUF2203 domain-containing protein [Nitrospiraceae bacterium]|jgi:hypothetical protein|nr:DUF2203 domain-containing protein [Nitrospiraceae bacterium]